MQVIKLLIVDDHKLIRAGISQLLAGRKDVEIIGQASNGWEAVKLAKKLRPDVILMDITMPEMDGIAALKAIKELGLNLRVVMLTVHQEPAYLKQVLELGAYGYIQKTAGENELMDVLQKVMSDETVVDSQLAGRLLRNLCRNGFDEQQTTPTVLNKREQEVLKLVALGFLDKEIADRLSISIKTVESYKARIKEKLGLSRLAELVRYAVEQGLV